MDVPGQGIVFQPVALLRRESGEAGLQAAEEVLRLKAGAQRLHGPHNEGQGRGLQNIAAAALVGRDAVALKDALQQKLVVPHIPGAHTDVPVAAFAPRHQPPDGGGALLHLGIGVRCFQQPDGLRLPLPGLGRAQEAPLQAAEWAVLTRRFNVKHFRLTASLFRQPEKGVPGAVRGVEELAAPAPLLPQQGDGDAPPLPQQVGKHLLLLGREVAEAIQEEVHALCDMGLLQVVAELAHPVPGVQARPLQPRLIGPVEEAQVPELFPGGAGQFLPPAAQILRRDGKALELVKEVQHPREESRLPGGTAVELQLRRHLAQGLLQRQELAPLVQRDIGQSPGDGEHPGPQPPEAQDLGVAAGGVAAGAAEVHLRRVGGMLRHQQHLPGGIPQCCDPSQHPLRLSALRPAHKDRQHGEPPFRFSRPILP